jgi:hypothetical protein
MQNVFYLKEAINRGEKNVSFIQISQKQLKDALIFTANTYLSSEKNNVILVSFSVMPEEIMLGITGTGKKRILIIDAAAKSTNPEQKNIITLTNPSDLTGIQIAIEQAEKEFTGNKVIIFDAVNALSIYTKKDTIAKFFHMYNNKIRLEDETGIIFIVKESADIGLVELLKEFADNCYDYSNMFNATLEMAEQM